MPRFLLLFLFATATLLAQQWRLVVANAASRTPEIAPGSAIIVGASALGPDGPIRVSAPPPFLHGIGGVAIVFQPAGDAAPPADALYVQARDPGSVTAIVPDSLPPGALHVSLLIDGVEITSTDTELFRSAPALYTVGDGYGPALAQNLTSAGPVTNGLTHPAVPRQFVTLWLTGLGDATADDITVDLAGSPLDVVYAGHNSAGLDQVNVRLPADPFLGCYVPLHLNVRGAVTHQNDTVSHDAVLSVNTTPGACAHPFGLSYSQMQTLDAGGQVVTPYLGVHTTHDPGAVDGPYDDTASLFLMPYPANVVFVLAGTQEPVESFPACSLTFLRVGVGVGGVGYVAVADQPKVGQEFQLAGPGGASQSLTLALPSALSVFPIFSGEHTGDEPLFSAGAWTLSGEGGDDLLSFQIPFHLPPQVRTLDRESLRSISRDTDLTVRWDPQGYSGGDLMTVNIANAKAAAICTTHAFTGSLTIPRAMLQQIPDADTPARVTLTQAPLPISDQALQLDRPDGEPWHGRIYYNFADTIETELH